MSFRILPTITTSIIRAKCSHRPDGDRLIQWEV